MTITERISTVYKTIGLPATIAIVLIVLAGLWFAYGGLVSTYDSYVSNKEIESLKQQADAERVKSTQAQAEAEQWKGAAAVYKQQAEEVDKELKELANARPELQRQTAAAAHRVEEIRNRPTVPVTGDMRQRIDELGAKLESLEQPAGQ